MYLVILTVKTIKDSLSEYILDNRNCFVDKKNLENTEQMWQKDYSYYTKYEFPDSSNNT